MSSSNLERVLNDVRVLTPDEQQQLRDALDAILKNIHPRMTEDEFEQRLVERRVISAVKTPVSDSTPYRNYKPIEVKGKPVSETIIEERR